MANKDQVIQTVFKAIDDVNALLMAGQRLAKARQTVLSSESGGLDSLGLVNLIVALEQRLQQDFETGLALVSEDSMSQQNSPFRDVESLSEYVTMLLQKKGL